MAKPKTIRQMDNIEWVTHLMTFSDHGALMQMFVLDAMHKYATTVASMDAKDIEKALKGSLVHPAAWHGVAKELVKRFEERGP